MFTKTINFRAAAAVFGRGAYYLAGDIESHKDLRKLHRWFLGTRIRGVYSLHAAAVAAERKWRSRPGAPRDYTYVEVIVSTPKDVSLDEGEDRLLAARIVDDFRCVAAMVGAHWHEEGRVDMHIFLLNETIEGLALGTRTVLPSTGRTFRNVEVLAREFADGAHEEINRVRERMGRPRIQPMGERRDELAKEADRRLEQLIARSAASARLLERRVLPESEAFSVTENVDARPIPVGVDSGGAGSAASAVKALDATPRSPPVVVEQWFRLTALLHRWGQLLAEDADEERIEKETRDKLRWFDERARLRLRPEIEAALALACERCIEEALEARETLQQVRQIDVDRSVKRTKDHGLRFD